MYSADRLRKITKVKLVMMLIATALPIIIILVMTPMKVMEKIPNYLKFSRYVILIIAEGIIINKIVGYIKVLTSELYFENVLIKKRDERLILIKQRSQSFSLKMLLYILLIGLIVSGFLNEIVFITILSIMGLFLLTMAITSYYYYKKF